MQQFDSGLVAEANEILKASPDLYRLAVEEGVEVAGLKLGQEADVDNAIDLPYWHRVKAETRKLLCTDDKKYAELRRRMTQTKDATEKVGVPAIAAAMTKVVGLEVALITPFISLLLVSIGQVGIAAWCAGGNDEERRRRLADE